MTNPDSAVGVISGDSSMAKKGLFPEVEQIISIINKDERQDLVILIIPSRDRNDKPLKDQEVWAGAAMDLFADLYRGATAFQTFQASTRIGKAKSTTTSRSLLSPTSSGQDWWMRRPCNSLLLLQSGWAERPGKRRWPSSSTTCFTKSLNSKPPQMGR